MKWPFRSKNKNNVPAEIQDYYQAEKRERTGVAWLVAALTLLITVAIALALFFGGRWLYRTLIDSDSVNQPVSQGESSSDSDGGFELPGNDEDKSDDQDAPGSVTDPDPAEDPATDSDADTPDTSDTPAEETSDESTNTPESLPSTNTPTTGPANGEIPNTGPGQIVTIFSATSAFGAVAHRLLRPRRSK